MTPTFQFSLHAGLDGLESLRPRWQALFARATNPVFYNDFRWHRALQQHLISEPLSYVLAECKQQPVAIIPLQLSQRLHAGIRVNYLHLPHHNAADLRDIVLDREIDARTLYPALLRYLRKHFPHRWDLLEWRDFTARSGLCRLICSESTGAACGSLENAGQSLFTRAAPDSSLSAGLSAKQLRNAERLLRKAQSEQPVESREYADSTAIEEGYEAFISVEQAGWKGEQGSAIAHNPERLAFYRDLATAFSATGQASIRLLKIGEQFAAGQLGLRSGDALHLLKIGYDESLASFGPGSAIMLRCLQAEEARGSQELNLVTSPAWADRWHFQPEPKLRLLEFNGSLLARLLKLGRQYRNRPTRSQPARKDSDGLNTSP